MADRYRVNGRALSALRAGWEAFDGEVTVSPLGEGHINDTYLVSGGRERFVLQRINERVFHRPAVLCANTDRLLAYLPGAGIRVPQLAAPRRGGSVHVDSDGGYWRLWRFVESARTLGTAITRTEARAAGGAFGAFQRVMEAFPPPVLEPAIPGFLELGRYLEEMDAALGDSRRAGAPPALIDFVALRRDLADRFPPSGDYIHGDCKIDNLLFAADVPEVRCVLDLDTVMLGNWAWDFGDLARSLLTTARAGDRRDGLALLVAAAAGMLEARGRECPLRLLVEAPRYVALTLGVRFLTDHLNGDEYFKVARRGENLQRAERQFSLIEGLESQEADLGRELEKLPGVLA